MIIIQSYLSFKNVIHVKTAHVHGCSVVSSLPSPVDEAAGGVLSALKLLTDSTTDNRVTNRPTE